MSSDDQERQRRLAAALRANLRRRKVQARGGQASDFDQPAAKDIPTVLPYAGD
jgi:hypothetical protein